MVAIGVLRKLEKLAARASLVDYVFYDYETMHAGMHQCLRLTSYLKLFAYIPASGYPPQTNIYSTVCHLYHHLCTNFGQLMSEK